MRDIQSHLAQDQRVNEQLLADLEAIADWRDDLRSRIRRAHLRFEFIGLDAQEQEALAVEVAAFKRVSTALADSLVDADDQERRAA
jgi:hypothetical protein